MSSPQRAVRAAERASWVRVVEFTLAVAVLLAVTKGPLYRIRWQAAPLEGDFLDDRWTQLAWATVYAVPTALLVTARRELATLSTAVAAAAAMPVIVTVSVLWSVDRERTASQAALLVLTTAAAFWIGHRLGARTFMWAVFVAMHVGVAVSLWAIRRDWVLAVDAAGRWAGIYFNPNSLGSPAGAGAMFAALVAADVLIDADWRRRLGWRAALVVAGCGVAIAADLMVLRRSGSITPASGAIASLGVIVLLTTLRRWRPDPRVPSWWFAALVVVIAAGAWRVALSSRDWVLESLGESPTLDSRTVIWEVIRHFAHQRPLLGWGFMAIWRRPEIHSTLQTWEPEHFHDVNEAHSGYYEVLLGVGAVGALVLAGVAFVAVLAGIRAWRNLRSPVVRVVPLATLGYVAAVNLTETYIGPNLLPWVLLVGVLAIGWGSVPKAGDHTTVGKT